SEILLQLNHLTGVLSRITTPDQHTPLSTDERKAVMQQLKASVDLLAKLADSALHMDGSRGGPVAETTAKGEEDVPAAEKGKGVAEAEKGKVVTATKQVVAPVEKGEVVAVAKKKPSVSTFKARQKVPVAVGFSSLSSDSSD
ncbi:hypothetical protein P167DRAFT_580833, partial [Morchella conica CCBAS932]